MEEQNVVIEITDTEIRMVVGFTKNNHPHISYMVTRPINGLISHGEINDFATLTSIVGSFKDIKDENFRGKDVVNDVTVILPALGLNIFEAEKTTNVVSNDNVIENIDISNVLELVRKEPVSNGSEVIDIVPDQFLMDGGRISTVPPIGQKSNQLTVKAKIHTLPTRVVSDYKRVIESAHISVKKFCLSSYATCELAKYTEGIPENYILVDMGAEVGEISLIGNHSPFGTVAFEGGGASIVNTLAEKYGVLPEQGLDLLTNYGYSNRKLSFEPVICKTDLAEITQKDLNKIIKDYFEEEYFPKFMAAFNSLMEDYREDVKRLPLVFTGGFSKMIGFDELAKEKFANHESIHFLEPNIVGAHSAQYSVSVGGLMIACAHKGALSEQKNKSKGLLRVA